jgi:hypothetical protein
MRGSVKASLRLENGMIIVEPQADFWSLAGSLKSKRRLTDAGLRRARKAFQSSWASVE